MKQGNYYINLLSFFTKYYIQISKIQKFPQKEKEYQSLPFFIKKKNYPNIKPFSYLTFISTIFPSQKSKSPHKKLKNSRHTI